MSYRLPPYPPSVPPSPTDMPKAPLVNEARQAYLSIDNGTISRIVIPCMYRFRNDGGGRHRMEHDHDGWPHPGHPDRSCQVPTPPGVPFVIEDMDLEGEGYTTVSVALGTGAPSGLSVTGSIEVGMVILQIDTTRCSSAATSDVEVPFAVYVSGQTSVGGSAVSLRSLVTKGTLRIVAGLLPS